MDRLTVTNTGKQHITLVKDGMAGGKMKNAPPVLMSCRYFQGCERVFDHLGLLSCQDGIDTKTSRARIGMGRALAPPPHTSGNPQYTKMTLSYNNMEVHKCTSRHTPKPFLFNTWRMMWTQAHENNLRLGLMVGEHVQGNCLCDDRPLFHENDVFVFLCY